MCYNTLSLNSTTTVFDDNAVLGCRLSWLRSRLDLGEVYFMVELWGGRQGIYGLVLQRPCTLRGELLTIVVLAAVQRRECANSTVDLRELLLDDLLYLLFVPLLHHEILLHLLN